MNHITDSDLHDFVDGALTPSSADVVRTHLLACDECAAQLASLEELRADTRALPTGITPPDEVWHELRARTIDVRARRWTLLRELRAPLAAAALALITVASAVTWWVARSTAPSHVIVSATSAPASNATMVALRQADADQASVTRTLLQVFQQRRSQMDPRVVAAVEQNLRTMDEAIAAARKALESDPANQDVASILNSTYQSKMKMLTRAVRVPGAI